MMLFGGWTPLQDSCFCRRPTTEKYHVLQRPRASAASPQDAIRLVNVIVVSKNEIASGGFYLPAGKVERAFQQQITAVHPTLQWPTCHAKALCQRVSEPLIRLAHPT